MMAKGNACGWINLATPDLDETFATMEAREP